MQIRNKFLTEFVYHLPDGACVLDVGCGKGKTLQMIAEARKDLELHAVDTEDVGGLLPEKVMFRVASSDELTAVFNENSFDAIICQHLIEHLPYPMKLMEECKKILKPHGVIYFETPNWTSLFIPFHPNYFWNNYTHMRPYSKTAFKRLFSDFKFTPMKLKSFSSSPLLTKLIISLLIPDILIAIAKNEK